MESPMGSFLCPPGYARPKGVRALAREGSVVTEAARYVSRSASDRLHRGETAHALPARDRGQSAVILVPGFMAGDLSLALLSRHLRRLGHRTYRSSIWANVGCTRQAGEDLERRIEAIAEKRGRRVSIVGHSLGGLIGRGVAARRPDLVEGLVTLGSPILAPGASHAVLQWDVAVLVRLHRAGLCVMGEDCTSGECARDSWEQARLPLAADIEFTSVFSRRDGIVDWRSCLDPQAQTVEVSCSHLGMAFDPTAMDVIAQALHAANEHRFSRAATLAEALDGAAG